MSNARVARIEKSKTWGQETNGEKRYIAVVSFVKGDATNKFVSVAFGTNSTYKLSFDLFALYNGDEKCKNDEGKFSPKKAFELFCEEYTPDDVNLYDIDLGGVYVVRDTKREMSTARIAIYGTREEAEAYAKRALARDLQEKRIYPKENASKQEKEEEEE